MAYCSSYYLYQRYEKRGDQDWIPSYPNVYSIDGEGSKPLRARQMYDSDCGWIPDTEVQYRTLSGTPYCTGYDLYVNETYQVSYDGGVTWETTGNEDVLVERNSHDCGYIDPIYRWVTVTPVSGDSSTYVCDDCTVDYRTISGTAYCDGYNKYVDVSSQVSYDGGVHWETTATTATLTEPCSDDCMASVPYANQYLTFVPLEECTFRCDITSCQYSLDCGLNWNWFYQDSTVTTNQKVLVRHSEWTSDPSSIVGFQFSSTGRFKAQGNIMSLMYGDNFTGKTTVPYPHLSFMSAFSGCTNLVDAENLVLPATGLTDYCYNSMFHSCTSLVKPPRELPATTMKQSCYGRMFFGCTALTTTPAIYGTRLATNCYERMFAGCTSLVNPTNSLTFYTDNNANYSFSAMFSGCTSLTSIPRLGASTNSYMYDRAFKDCTSLTGVTLPFTRIANGNVYQMFDGCSNLSYVKCNATYIDSGSSYCWLRGVAATGTFCKASSGTTWASGESGIPYGWTVTYPIYRWVDTTETTCYNCNKYYVSREEVSYDEGQTWTPTSRTSYGSLIEGNSYDCGYREKWINSGTTCSDGDLYNVEIKQESKDSGQTWTTTTEMRQGSLIESGSSECSFDDKYLTFVALENGTFKFTGNAVSYSLDSGSTWNSLANGTNSPTVPIGGKIMWKATLSNSSGIIGKFSSSGRFNIEGNAMSLLHGDNFSGKTSLSGYGLRYLFSGCTTVVSAKNLSLPATSFTNNYCYSKMFEDCTSLTTAPNILPSMSLKPNCYEYMFHNCTSLTTAPVLPATALANNCYDHMFYGCTSLNYIKCLASSPSSTYTNYWVYNVSPSGVFVKNENATWSSGASGIPSGWAVQNA